MKEKITKYEKIINPVEYVRLDEQQLGAIVKDCRNQLVIAGAGTGKTTTIIGYIKYLINVKKVNPNEILALSFTNASASEMSERIVREIGQQVEASTFHKLGLNIIASVLKEKPSIYNDKLNRFVKGQLKKLVENDDYLKKVYSYLYSLQDKTEFEFKSENQYIEYLRQNPPTSLKGEMLKSHGERLIANYLASNGINYQYEEPYKIKTNNKEYGQYRPDFYLLDYDIYIEYYGINRENKVPDWFKGKDGKSGSEVYIESINWKRKIHKENKTKCLELFAYEHFENTLLESLDKKLRQNGVMYKPLEKKELWCSIDNAQLEILISVFVTINLMKNNDCSFYDLILRNETLYRPFKLEIFIDLLKPIYYAYECELKEKNQIDFNDMINMATKYVENNHYLHNYRYVIIDEYQDISQSRFKLLYAMRKQKDFTLFCVGDDWQSIYRFAGSDLGFIIKFDKYWGPTMIDKIETTYRFTPNLIRISSAFIMQNPIQIKKYLRSEQIDKGYGFEILDCNYGQSETSLLKNALNKLDKNVSILLLGRYSFDIKVIEEDKAFYYYYDNKTEKIVVEYAKRTDLKIFFMTVHASKGLQADYVIILNNKDSITGFPSKISDPPIIQLLIDNCDNYLFAEERRLFYVALTRAKRKVFFLLSKGKKSCFLKEIEKMYGEEMKKERYTCPKCGGMLIRKEGQYGQFWGCTNYKNGCKYTRNDKVLVLYYPKLFT